MLSAPTILITASFNDPATCGVPAVMVFNPPLIETGEFVPPSRSNEPAPPIT